jgi:hypothetical protein
VQGERKTKTCFEFFRAAGKFQAVQALIKVSENPIEHKINPIYFYYQPLILLRRLLVVIRTVCAVRTVKTAGAVARERTCGFFNSQATKKTL